MDHLGHGLALDHVIFRAPRAPRFEWVEKPRPEHHEGMTSPLHPDGVPETLRLAKFEREKPAGWNPTLVSHEGFFTDVPGFENLAEGHSSKMLGSLALARQGRYFYWGYSADPAELSEAGADVLVNVLHYMVGQREARTVPFVCKTRKILRVYTILGRDSGYRRGVEEHFPGSLVPEWRDTYTASFEGAEAWVAKYLPYVFSGKSEVHHGERYTTRFEVDADALALETPNAARSSLERWIDLATEGEGEDRERARRCLKRYVHPDLRPDTGDWRAWYAREKERIAFVESSGFYWMVHPEVLEREAAGR